MVKIFAVNRIIWLQKPHTTFYFFTLFFFLVSSTTENLGTSTNTETQYETTLQRALAWLITQRDTDYGWRNDTPKILTALQVASQHDEATTFLPSYYEMQLSTKQMEIEIVILLWR